MQQLFDQEKKVCSLSVTFSNKHFSSYTTRTIFYNHLRMCTLFTIHLLIFTLIFTSSLTADESAERLKRETPPTSPRFTHLFQETVLDAGSKFSLKCEAVASPLPQIVWTLDGSPIVESHSRIRIGDYVTNQGVVNSFINLTSVRIDDGGLYSCSASNGLESITHSARINVKGAPHVKPIANLTVISGEKVSIDCPYSGYPIGSITWERKSSDQRSSSTPSSWIKLPQNHRQVVYPNGTLVIRKIDRSNDEDHYRCLVTTPSSPSSLSASSSLFIKVVVAPVISPFSSAPNLREGMRSLLTCSVLEGDPPFTFKWLKDDRLIYDSSLLTTSFDENFITESGSNDGLSSSPLKTNGLIESVEMSSNMKISSNNDFSSSLFLSKVSYHDSANFTCIVSNPAASTNYTISHLVKVPPKWLVAPIDTQVIQGKDVTVNCQATGYPHPRIWWERANELPNSAVGSSGHGGVSHYAPVISNSHIHALENGSLIIKDASKSDEGSYLCQATNGVSSGISKVVKISVRVPPSFRSAFNAVTARKGESVVLNCDASGEKPISMTWTKDRMAFDPTSDPSRYEMSTSGSSYGLDQVVLDPSTPSVAIGPVTSDTSKTVHSHSSSLYVTPPSTFFGQSSSMKHPEVVGQQLTSGQQEATAAGDSRQLLTRNQLTIKSVDRKDSALYTCIAVNNFGRAEYNIQLIVQEPPDRPENVVATSIDSRSAIITWTMSYTGNSAITSFQIESESIPSSSYMLHSRNPSSLFSSSSASSVSSHSSLHPSPSSSILLLDTISSSSNSWSNDSPSLTSESSSSATSSSGWVIQTVTGNSNSITLRKLKPLTRIQVRLKAENMFGWSDYSDILTFVTDEEAPSSPPKSVHVYPLSSRSLQVTWKQPAIEGHNGIIKGYYLGYKLHGSTDPFIFKTVSIESLSPNDLTSTNLIEVKINDLKRGSKYSIIVQAFNTKGPGPQSDEIVGETMINDPPPAPILTIASVSYNTIELIWSFNESSVIDPPSSPSDGYNKHPSNAQRTIDGPESRGGKDVVGGGRKSPSSSSVVSSLEVSGFYLHSKSAHSGWEEKQISGSLSSYTFHELSCGTYHQFYLIAYNNIGKGDPSQVVATKTKGSLPEPPRSSSHFISSNSTAASLNLMAWKSIGCPIKTFSIQYKIKSASGSSARSSSLLTSSSLSLGVHGTHQTQSDTDWITLSSNVVPEQREISIVDLRPGTWYSLLMIANSDPGPVQREYLFATLTDAGGTISPLDQTRPLMTSYTSLTLLIPSSCAVIVLAVILFLGFNIICKPKDHGLPPPSCDGTSTIGTINRSNSSGHHGHSHSGPSQCNNIYFDDSNHCPAHPDVMVGGHRGSNHHGECSLNQDCDESTILSVLDHRRSHRHHLRAHLNNQHHSNRKESCLNEMNLMVHGSSCPGGGGDINEDGTGNCMLEGDEGMTLPNTCTPSKIFYPSPYAIEQSQTGTMPGTSSGTTLKSMANRSSILIDSQRASVGYSDTDNLNNTSSFNQHKMGQDQSSHCHPLSTCHSNGNHSQQQQPTSDHHHTYAIPFPPKWV